ncbi:GNAT family N-acetyltransferase [Paenibacillus sp. LMG 31456]|uniref:GNAT family N-acetyltransferase n=1 Tax=Paenibacillus foliorum TaxID=2654974 RepID=A0A972GLW5_9BACL|nr:GNAT family protein [Paenibacillus foliorum]NOU93117.1 GNAT family N-acetyltransferase [Paenibacillus foliorum]
MIQLQTERTIIRDHNLDDLPTHHSLFSDKKVMYYLQDIATHSLDESKNNLLSAITEIQKLDRKYYFFRIEVKRTGEHIGEIGYTVTTVTPLGNIVEVGFFIRDDYWGKGYTAEALKEVMRFAFEENNVFRISCGCIKENVGSEKVMIKCGMIKEADFKSVVWHNGEIKDRVEYRLLKDEWKTVTQGMHL